MNHFTEAYLSRIGYSGSLCPDLQTLTQLQKAHLLQVPFENLDIHTGRSIRLSVPDFFSKIVTKRRGGFCYELNGLFGQLLQTIGYRVRLVSARVYDREKGYGPEFDHMALLVKLGHRQYLTDVGFGEFSFAPLSLAEGSLHQDERGLFCLDESEPGNWVVHKIDEAGEKVPEYAFNEQARKLEEFAGMCGYHQSSPESHFTQQKLITRPTAAGRITLTATTLKIREEDGVQEQAVRDQAHFYQLLSHYFPAYPVKDLIF